MTDPFDSIFPFPEKLVEIKHKFIAKAKEYGLKPFPVIFDILPFERINEAAAYEGFPSRYPHWRFGMNYDFQTKTYTYGLQKIYEMVINNDPCYAYLLEGTSRVVQKMVMAHVIGHSDFFANNAFFAYTNRNMLNEMANHGSRIRHYQAKKGVETVEILIEAVLSIENLIDPLKDLRPSRENLEEDEEDKVADDEIRTTQPYLGDFIRSKNPQKTKEKTQTQTIKPEPKNPTKAILDYLLDNAPLEGWEQDILDMLKGEAYYFLPQRLTKIMNEGWAVFWHTRLMVDCRMAEGEFVAYADENSKILSLNQGSLNPYRLGFKLFKDIEERWNRGRHGSEWEACDDLETKKRWDTREGRGIAKLLEVRAAYNDVMFIDEFLTKEIIAEEMLFTYSPSGEKDSFTIESRDPSEVKETLIRELTNGGEPIIILIDANYHNRGELYLMHKHDGVDLRQIWARDTLKSLFRIWKRPVHIETKISNRNVILIFDGSSYKEE